MLNCVEFYLGFSFGLGTLSSLRFLGLVGPSEVILCCVLIFMIFERGHTLFNYDRNISGFFKLFFLVSVFFVLPCVTAAVYLFTDYKNAPEYIVAYAMGVLLMFLVVEKMRSGFRFGIFVITFAAVFTASNGYAFLLSPPAEEISRFSGGANNPNQLLFYGTSLITLLLIYKRLLSFVFVPLVVLILHASGSDTFMLFLAVLFAFYFILKFCLILKIKPWQQFIMFIAVACFVSMFALLFLSDELAYIWLAADEGGARLALMYNAFKVSLISPFFGFGSGSFSGLHFPFMGWEAHNTFLDFSVQFGFLFPIFLYYIMFSLVALKIKDGLSLQASVLCAYIVTSFFHFSGRHFIFWFEMATFFYILFYSQLPRSAQQKDKS